MSVFILIYSLTLCLGKKREWDDSLLPQELPDAWNKWAGELQVLPSICLPRCYTPEELAGANITHEVHVFCDASEMAYGVIAYLRPEDIQNKTYLTSLMARSRVAPKSLLSMPRLESCACGGRGPDCHNRVQQELTLKIIRIIMWTDSTTVLKWLHSESWRVKVFVGTSVVEIQELTDVSAMWIQ